MPRGGRTIAQAGAGYAGGGPGLAILEIDGQALAADRRADPGLAHVEPEAWNDLDAPAESKTHDWHLQVESCHMQMASCIHNLYSKKDALT